MAWTTDALSGLAQRILVPASIGTWLDSGAYADTDQGIVVGTVPQSPDAVIVLMPYPLTDDPTLSDSVLGLQIRVRGANRDPRPVMDTMDEIFETLHNHPRITLSPTAVLVTAERTTGVPLGEDRNGRYEAADSYHLSLWRPSTHRE